MGYGNGEFGYRLWDPAGKKVIRSRDVVFLEDETFEDLGKVEKLKPTSQPFIDFSPIPSPVVNSDHGGDTRSHETETEVEVEHEIENFDEQQPPVQLEQPVSNQPVAPEQQQRKSNRVRQPSVRYSSDDYVMLADGNEPESYQEAMLHERKSEWTKAMQEEMDSLHENHTFELMHLPKGKKALKNKWVFRVKAEGNGSKPRYKARLVVK